MQDHLKFPDRVKRLDLNSLDMYTSRIWLSWSGFLSLFCNGVLQRRLHGWDRLPYLCSEYYITVQVSSKPKVEVHTFLYMFVTYWLCKVIWYQAEQREARLQCSSLFLEVRIHMAFFCSGIQLAKIFWRQLHDSIDSPLKYHLGWATMVPIYVSSKFVFHRW